MSAIETADGLKLEIRWDLPDGAPAMVVVFCHPHPLHGGTMTAPLMNAVTAALTGHGMGVLRFNFRGVGGSEGAHGGGNDEYHDVDAAIEAASAAYPAGALALAGWSFGAATSLNWLADSGKALPWCGIAPPVRSDRTPDLPPPDRLPRGPKTFIIGDRDQFTTVEALEAYAQTIDAQVAVVSGSDHFFYFREDRVGSLMAEALLGSTD